MSKSDEEQLDQSTELPDALAPVEAKTIDLADWIEKKEAQHQRSARAAPMVSVDERHYERLMRAQIMLAALVKREGRVRLSRRELDEISKRDGLDFKVQESGDVVVSYLSR